jgi:uncharacterized repeat protein (TIGR01451 family)
MENKEMKAKRLLTSLLLGLGLLLALLWLFNGQSVTQVYADGYTVSNANASGPGSLRQAIIDAEADADHDTIDFAPHVTGTVVLTDALPVINHDLTIQGPGADQLSVSGDNSYRVFEIDSGAAVTITGLTIRDGSTDNSTSDNGGGVYVDGSLTLSAVKVISNRADLHGGGVYVYDGSASLTGAQLFNNSSGSSGGGLLIRSGSASLNRTQVMSNSASSHGGGVFVSQGSATLKVTGGRLANNSAASAGGAVYVLSGSATLTGTEVMNNSAAVQGGGVYVLFESGTLNVTGGRLAGNSAVQGGGVYVWQGSATLTETQVVSNSAGSSGGGLYVGSSGGITATNGCIVFNSDTAVENSGTGTLDAGHNWWGMPDGPSGVGPGRGDSVSANVTYLPVKTSRALGCPAYIDLVISKVVTPTTAVPRHGVITYTVLLNNSGPLSDTNVLFTDTLPSGEVDFASWVTSPTGTLLNEGVNEITWSGTVTAGHTLTWAWTAIHTGNHASLVTNTAEFSGTLEMGQDDAIFSVTDFIYLPLVLRNE